MSELKKISMISMRAQGIRDPFIYAFHNPWREENVFELEWSRVDPLNWTVRVEVSETKAQQAIDISLDGECLEMLKRRYTNRGRNPLVFHRDGKKIGDFRNTWREATIACGLGEMREVERKGKKYMKYFGKLFHDLRRTSGRNHVRAGTNEKVVMGLGGWKTRSTFDRYNIVSTKDLKEAAMQMTSFIDGQEELAKKAKEIETQRKKTTVD